jgi:hypothetical protein
MKTLNMLGWFIIILSGLVICIYSTYLSIAYPDLTDRRITIMSWDFNRWWLIGIIVGATLALLTKDKRS